MDSIDRCNHYDDEIKSATLKLVELCPGSGVAIEVLVSWVQPDGSTRFANHGSGNMFARIGMAQDFVDSDKATTLSQAISRDEED